MQLPVCNSTSDGFSEGGIGAFRLIGDELAQTRKLVNKQLANCSESVGQFVGAFNICSGKMLRPGLVLLCGAGCGKMTEQHIRIAAIVEMIHNATLLHDDVIDEGQRRRGVPTVNSTWGNERAVLLGDFLLSKVFKMCAELEPQVAKKIAATTARICEGELRQIIARDNWQLTESEYIDIITEKSASFFTDCCGLGAILAGGSEKQVQALSRFGLDVGIAFQITDDLLDIIGDESKTGKMLGTDVAKNELTLSVIHMLSGLEDRERGAVIEKLSAAGQSQSRLPEIVEMLRLAGSIEYAREKARQFVTEAVEALTDLEESDAKQALIETARFAADRVL